MSYTVRFAPVVLEQIAELESYISRSSSPAAASRYIEAILGYCERLATFPSRGRKRDDLLPGLRITTYRRRTVIAFLVDPKARIVSIVGIYHGGQNYECKLPAESES